MATRKPITVKLSVSGPKLSKDLEYLLYLVYKSVTDNYKYSEVVQNSYKCKKKSVNVKISLIPGVYKKLSKALVA